MTEKSNSGPEAIRNVMDLTYGLWRSQTLYAGVELGVFDAVGEELTSASEIADELALDPDQSYRLLRALGSLGLLDEHADREFALTAEGTLLRADHPASLSGVVEIINSPDFATPWNQIPDFVREGEETPFEREHGQSLFDRTSEDPEFADLFNNGMSSLTQVQSEAILGVLAEYDFESVSQVCDVAGGRGYMLCKLLAEYPHLEGTVLDLPSTEGLVAPKLGVEDRCSLVGGDMFESVPEADRYTLKHVLHDWGDEEYVQILSTIHESAPEDARVLVIEPVISGPDSRDFPKLYDMYMMSSVSGRVRTDGEHTDLLAEAGWERTETRSDDSGMVTIIEVEKA